MKRLAALILALLALPVLGTDISPGLSIGTGSGQIQDGQRLSSAKILQLVSDATIQPAFYTGKVGQSNLTSADTILVVSAASGTFHKLTGNQFLFQNYALITDQSVYTTLGSYGTFLLYDPTNGVFGQISLSNLMVSGSQFVNPSNFVMMKLGTNTLEVAGVNPNPWNTNNQAYFMMWTSNSVRPQAIPFSNLLNSAAGYIGTNTEPKYVFAQMFTPNTFYYTNHLTNVWGFTNVAAITNLHFGTNTLLFTNNQTVAALTNTDTLPIRSTTQGDTNTTVTLGALTQFFVSQLPSTNRFVSLDYSLSAGQIVNTNHNLGAAPQQVYWTLVCNTADASYTTNDEINVSCVSHGDRQAFAGGANSTNVFLALQATTSLTFPGKDGTANSTLTASRWKVRCYARP